MTNGQTLTRLWRAVRRIWHADPMPPPAPAPRGAPRGAQAPARALASRTQPSPTVVARQPDPMTSTEVRILDTGDVPFSETSWKPTEPFDEH